MMGDKVAGEGTAAEAAGVPTLRGPTDGPHRRRRLLEIAAEIGFPLVIKAAAGGGGRGIRLVHAAKDWLLESVERARGRSGGRLRHRRRLPGKAL